MKTFAMSWDCPNQQKPYQNLDNGFKFS
uniref:Uncharacterized protein n=1 Tax=Megaselia scalaris TaxID=36166 RepID=T1GLE1_MEGSC